MNTSAADSTRSKPARKRINWWMVLCYEFVAALVALVSFVFVLLLVVGAAFWVEEEGWGILKRKAGVE